VSSGEAYCPHCFLLVASGVGDHWPPSPSRCPHCRLVIGPGRARSRADGIPGARGAAAGVIAAHARDRVSAPERPAGEILDGIRAVARHTATPVDRLLMIDYQQCAVRNPSLPQLDEILAAFGSWKRARRQAAAIPGAEAA
jgi:hypothetical protein